ncbi:MAG: hypothetical protein N2C13_05100 [Chloroflexota bacterium]
MNVVKSSISRLIFLSTFILAALLVSCGGTEEIVASATATVEIIPTSTSTPTPIQAVTATLPPTATATPLPTVTPQPVFLTLKESAFCRQGPGTIYPILEFVPAGYQTEVIGIGDLGEQYLGQIWYILAAPESGENCWVYGELVELSSDGSGLAMVVAPPTRTPLPLPTVNPNGLIYYMILLGTGGPHGCGDSLIPVNSGIKKTGDTEKDIILALNALFGLKTEYSGALYNALYQSSLKAKSVDINGGVATVYTRGTVVKPKDDCDKERFRLQVFVTVKSFSGINSAVIYANNVFLGDLLEQGNK